VLVFLGLVAAGPYRRFLNSSSEGRQLISTDTSFLSWDGKQDIERGLGIGAEVCAFGRGVFLGILHCDGMMDE
jgi:hypothetical protein